MPPPTDRQNLDYVFRSAISGGVAGCAAKTLIAPLDRVKILFQTKNPEFQQWAGTLLGLPRSIRYITRTEGVFGLLRGHSATLLRVFPYAAVKFVAYEQIRGVIISTNDHETHVRRFLTGSLAGLCSVLFTYPLDVIRVQIAYRGNEFQEHRLFHTVRAILEEDGGSKKILNLYSGFFPTLLGVIPYAGVSFLAHDILHDIFRNEWLHSYAVNWQARTSRITGKKPLHNWAQLIAGGLSGVLAQTSAYPLEVVRRRMQVAGITKSKLTLMNTVKAIYAEGGIRAFFVGLSIGYMKIAPMFACSFLVYERMKTICRI